MKRLLLIVLPLLLIVGCSKEPINYEETLKERDGVFYTKDSNKPYSGLVFSINSNGFYSEQGTLEDGKKHGLWIQNYENSKLYIEENYNYGVKNGSFKKYDRNGEELEISNYLNGQYHGECKFIFPHFREEYSGNYINGKRDGEWKLINKDNINRDTWEYIPTIYTYKNGIEIPSERNDYRPFDGLFTKFYESGRKKLEGNYKNGKKDGLWTVWYDVNEGRDNINKIKNELTYKDGKKHGLFTKWDDVSFSGDGIVEKGNYKDGKKDGLWWWIYDGKLYKETYKGDLITLLHEYGQDIPIQGENGRNNLKELIEENGNKYREYKVISDSLSGENGLRYGLWTEWYENGQMREQGNYKITRDWSIQDNKDGLWTEWYKNGQKSNEVIYKDDLIVEVIGEWNEDGGKRGYQNLKNLKSK
jgi:antitoxin component YwqK of YwqJK toxin-antitoxin module